MWGQNKEVAHNITIKILSWKTFVFYSKKYMKFILTLGMELWRIGSMRLVTKYIRTKIFYSYYTREKNYHPILKLGTDGGKVVGTELGRILIHLQLIHHSGRNNPLLLRHHHEQVIYCLLFRYNQKTKIPIETIFPRMSEE